MEDYEKKYKEALSRAATELETCGADKSLRNMIYAIFPDELKESEDENIRKEIIDFLWKEKIFLQEAHSSVENNPKYRFVMDAIAWLEKQGQTFTKKDVDDAYLKGICDAKHELEKQGEQKTAEVRTTGYWNVKDIDQKPFDYEHATITQKDFASVGETATIELSSPIDCGDRIYHVSHKPIEKHGEQKPIDYNKELKKCRENPLYFFDKYVKLEKQKPACSEEDERVKKRILLSLEKDLMATKNSGCDTQDLEQCIVWLEKQGKSSDQIHYWTEEEIEPINSDYLRGVEHYGGMIGRLRCLKPKSIEKQGSSSVKWQKNTLYNKPAINHSVLMKTTQGIAEGEWQGEHWFQYRWSWTLKDSDVLAWMELSDLSEQGEQKTAVTDFNAKDWYVSKVDGKIHDMTYNPADKVEPKFKVKYAGSEYNVLEVKDIAGVTFYGIEDEPNHIDYVKADNCEIISGYGIKENGSPYPTKPSMFSEQKPAAWSDEDEENLQHCCMAISVDSLHTYEDKQEMEAWLKSLKNRIGG